MKKNLTKIFIVLSVVLLNQNSYAIDAKEIIKRSDERVRGNSQMIEFEILIKARRFERTLKMLSYEVRKSRKSFAVIKAPKKDEGNRFLLIKNNMWHYQPKIQKTIKISPSMMLNSWMGSDFTNDDIVKQSSILEDYTHTILSKETVDGHSCYKIQLKPKPNAPVVWGKILYYARVTDYLPVKQELYNERDILKKLLTYSDFKKMHDRVIPCRYKMVTIGKKGQYTIMYIKKAKYNISIPGRIFTKQYLKKG